MTPVTSAAEHPTSEPEARDRRIRKSQRALRDAFISLVLERGYDAVTVEDIAERADVARATFYAHFADKDQLLTTLFEQMIAELSERVPNIEGAPKGFRTHAVRAFYTHAAQYRDLYLVCLRGAGDGKARAAYGDLIAARARASFGERLRVTQREPGAPLAALGPAWAGLHVALLEEWLERGDVSNLDAAVRVHMDIATKGFAWALGMLPDEVAVAFPEV
jgi:AcrR family transcriptional regulator